MTVTISTLANGMKVATDQMNDVETVSLGFWVGVGTRDESVVQNGVAHLCEHMVFKGTATRSARDVAESIENVGGHMNAYTSREQTAFYAKVLANDAALVVDVLSDILQNASIDGTELERERGVVLQEIAEANDTPDDRVFDNFQQIAFPEQQIGLPILGNGDSVKSLQSVDVAGWLGNHYQPSSLLAVAAGRIEHQAFASMVERNYTHQKHAATQPVPKASAAQFKSGTSTEIRREIEQNHLVVGFKGVNPLDPRYYGFNLFSTILGGGMSSRLFQEVREQRGLVYTIYSFFAPYRDTGVLGIYAGSGVESLGELLPVIAQELASLTGTITDLELSRAKAQIRAGTLMARENTGPRADSLAQQLMAYGRVKPLEETLAAIEAVTVADVQQIAADLIASPFSLSTVGPETAGFDCAEVFADSLAKVSAAA
ncbi:MAG: pitrilysin family protein [Candidatus Pacebacteria bacterium]|nr:pitrilysin family protein [Candidatus Paceibacterota bacterium]